ncbi:ice-binding family protein [Streptomyces sp. NBC_01197]|uniref:ice-binding family protein n=1 Tax=Streptomyces sp. NBC_01197 TaxID=2903768 RepID=UPI002E0EE292|nr:ice-binding family protein [Streptomyces sp. NBC_01197]
MKLRSTEAARRRTVSAWLTGTFTAVVAAGMVAVAPAQAFATATPVPLGTADSFAVLAGQSITNTGPSVITGDIGVSPGTAISGFPPGIVNGAQHSADAVALQAKSDLVAAFNNAAGQATDAALPPDAGGLTLVPGVYTASSTLGLTGTLTLDAHGDPNAVWVFQVGSGLTTASASRVSLINGAQPCNVFWEIGSSATLGTNSTFVGNILALTSIGATTGASIDGRALARNGSVTLDTNRITRPTCSTGPTGGTTTGTTAGTTTGGTTTGTTAGVLGGVLGGVLTGGTTGGTSTGGVLGGVLGGALTGGTIGGTSGGGGTTGSTTGNIAGNTSGNVAGNTTGGGNAGNTTGGGNGGKPGHDHGGKPGHDHGGKPGHDHGGKPGHDHGGYGGDNGGYGDKPEQHGGYGDKPEQHGGYGDKPEQHGGYEG